MKPAASIAVSMQMGPMSAAAEYAMALWHACVASYAVSVLAAVLLGIFPIGAGWAVGALLLLLQAPKRSVDDAINV